MELFDAHVTVGQGLHLQLDPPQYLEQMERCGISRAFISPPDRCLAVDNDEGNRWILGLLDMYPDQFFGYATANPWYGEKGCRMLRAALSAGLHGVKLHPVLQGFMLFDETLKPILDIAGEFGAVVYVHTGAPMNAMPLQVAAVAALFPEINFIMGRMGKTDYAADVIPALRQAANIYAETAYNYPQYLRNVIDEFGSERVVFSTDAPLTFPDQEVNKFHDIDLSEEEREQIAWRNITRLAASGAS